VIIPITEVPMPLIRRRIRPRREPQMQLPRLVKNQLNPNPVPVVQQDNFSR
jgi:hypothetical protein